MSALKLRARRPMRGVEVLRMRFGSLSFSRSLSRSWSALSAVAAPVSLSIVCAVAASGCAGARWSVVDARPLATIAVAPAELHGPVDEQLVAARRAVMIGELRAHGYHVVETATPGVSTLTMKVEGELFDDSRLHAPDDARHHIYNDLHYQFVDYKVHIDLVDASGRVRVCGSASADRDPERALNELTARFVHDVPPVAATLAAR